MSELIYFEKFCKHPETKWRFLVFNFFFLFFGEHGTTPTDQTATSDKYELTFDVNNVVFQIKFDVYSVVFIFIDKLIIDCANMIFSHRSLVY